MYLIIHFPPMRPLVPLTHISRPLAVSKSPVMDRISIRLRSIGCKESFQMALYYIPTPQTIQTTSLGFPLGFSSYSIAAHFQEDQFVANSDYVISSKHTLSERLFYSRYVQLKPLDSTGGNGAKVPGSPSNQLLGNWNPTLKLTSVLTNNLVNEVRVGGTYFETNAVGLNAPTATSLGQAPATPLFNEPVPLSITGNLGSYSGISGSGEDWLNFTQTVEAGDQVSWVHGKQTFRFGGLVDKNYYHLIALGRAPRK